MMGVDFVQQLAETVIDLIKMEKFHADIYPIFSQASDAWALEIFVSTDYFISPDVPYENVIYWINETRKLSVYPETIRKF